MKIPETVTKLVAQARLQPQRWGYTRATSQAMWLGDELRRAGLEAQFIQGTREVPINEAGCCPGATERQTCVLGRWWRTGQCPGGPVAEALLAML
jgi:hypothetical protein